MSQPVSIPDELYHHLVEQAEKTRTSVETLVTHLLEKALSPAAGSDLLDEITQAYHVLWEYCRKDFCSFKEAKFAENAVLIKVLGSPS